MILKLNFEIVSTASTQLSWSHFIGISPLKLYEEKLFYLNESIRGFISIKELRRMINHKAYERKEIADTQLTSNSLIPIGTFKDPYL